MHDLRLKPPPRRALLLAALALAFSTLGLSLLGLQSAASAEISADGLFLVRDAIDRGKPEEALGLLDSLSRGKPGAEELLVRGMARIMLGDLKKGAKDLETAVDRDPTLRDGWMNLAGLEIAEGNYDKALQLLQKAHDLAPESADIHLNLGAVLLQLGRSDEAFERFDRYLALDSSAEARYLVAANHAMLGNQERAVENLRQSIRLDERQRLRARRDDRFAALDSLDYRVLLHSDDYRPPADHRRAAAAFKAKYDQKDPKLLYALMDSLREVGLEFDPEIETTARWALLWGSAMRIKVSTQSNGTGVVTLTAPPSSYTAQNWQRTSDKLFRVLHRRLGL
ncbi:MAG: tetratricopeptide repeat protein [Acidobacteriota bacterium]